MPELTTREKLIHLHGNIHGGDLKGTETEVSLIVDLLECIIDKLDEHENHSHTLM